MAPSIFINLPVRDLSTSMAYYRALGFALNSQFSDDTAACIVLSDTIYVMLLTHEKFAGFTSLPIADARTVAPALYALTLPSRDQVDAIAAAALAAGGTEARPSKDHGFMYDRAIADPDGHIWEYFWMDQSQAPAEPTA